jgi:hypothetical protein
VCWIPKGTVIVNIKHHKHLLADELIINRVKSLFSKRRCSLSREALLSWPPSIFTITEVLTKQLK